MTGLYGQNPWRGLLFALAATALMSGAEPALAASTAPAAPAPAAAADPVFESQKSAFNALPEADRRAIQDALVWTGDYNGVVDGAFGKRTRDSILAYQANVNAPTNGVVDPTQLATLVATAQKAKAAVKFLILSDDKTGVRIGAPLKILDKRVAIGAGSRLMKADGSVTLDLASQSEPEGGLAELYARAIADAPGRKVTLKLSRPDFFVVSGEAGGRKFYSRFAKAPAGWPDPALVRAFTLSYPAQAADFDRLVLAVANSFDPFPAASTTAVASTTTISAAIVAPSSAAVAASGLLVASGEALSAIGSAECPRPSINGKPVKYLHEDKQSGLSLIGVESHVTVGALSLAPLGEDLVALSYAQDDSDARPVLNVTPVSPLAQTASAARPLLLASLPKNATGGPVFDRKGRLAAVIASAMGDPKLVAGVTPLAPHAAITAADIERFLASADVAMGKAGDDAASGAGRLAADKSELIVAIACK